MWVNRALFLLLVIYSAHGFAIPQYSSVLSTYRRPQAKTRLIASQLSTIPPVTPAIPNKNLISLMISVSYMSIIIAVMTTPPCLSYLSADPNFKHATAMPIVLFTATLATMVGKFILAPPTDSFGGNLIMKLSMGVNILLLLMGSVTSTAYSFGLVWILLSFFYASAWGACSKLVRDIFPQAEWSSQLGMIAAASRLGSLGSSFVFGGILGATKSWQKTFIFSAFIQAAIFIFYLFADRVARLDQASKPPALASSVDGVRVEHESIPAVLTRVSRDAQFWLMFAGKIALMTVGQFISFIPLYLTTGIKLDASRAAMSAASFSTGSLVSNVIGARYYRELSTQKQVTLVATSNLIAFIASLMLFGNTITVIALKPSQVLALLSTWGATWAAAFYVPPGLVALELGGSQHAALITNIFDAGGFLGASILSYYAMKYGRAGHWSGLLAGLSGCSLIAFFTMFGAMRISMIRKLRSSSSTESRSS